MQVIMIQEAVDFLCHTKEDLVIDFRCFSIYVIVNV